MTDLFPHLDKTRKYRDVMLQKEKCEWLHVHYLGSNKEVLISIATGQNMPQQK